MRQTDLVTISLPRSIRTEAEKVAKKQGMTRSELLRFTLRHFLEEMQMEKAVSIAEKELAAGKLKLLPRGGLARLAKGR